MLSLTTALTEGAFALRGSDVRHALSSITEPGADQPGHVTSPLYAAAIMSPDHRSRRSQSPRNRHVAATVRTDPSPDDVHEVVFFQRHRNDDPAERAPAERP
jgi:hypothetical protein